MATEAIEKKIEEVKIEDEPPALEPSDEQPPPLESAPAPAASAEGAEEGGDKPERQSRSEKKARKEMMKLKLKPVPGILRVTIKKSKNILFVVSKPDVFKLPASDTYIIFGEAKIEDLNTQALTSKAKSLLEQPEGGAATNAAAAAAPAAPAAKPAAKEEVEDPNEQVDDTGIEPKDIELVINQTHVSRNKENNIYTNPFWMIIWQKQTNKQKQSITNQDEIWTLFILLGCVACEWSDWVRRRRQ